MIFKSKWQTIVSHASVRPVKRSVMAKSLVLCALSSCSISFGVIFLMSGLIVIVVSSVSPSSPYRENTFLLQTRQDINANSQTVSIILMSVGGAFVLLSLVFIILSAALHRRTSDLDVDSINRNNRVHLKEQRSQKIRRNNTTVDVVKQTEAKKVNELIEDNEITHPSRGDINTIGLPLRLPHNGFSYICNPPLYTQRSDWKRNCNSSEKELKI